MTVLEKLSAWLLTCPYLAGASLSINSNREIPGSMGLYPKGCVETKLREDVLGNRSVTCRESFLLYQVGAMENAQPEGERLMALQNWVREQSLAHHIPQFGDVPGRERIRAEKGKLFSVSGLGTGKFAVEITLEYEKIFEGSV